MKEKTCCFTGHRDIPSGAYQLIFKKTEEMVESLIQKGYLYFGAGGALGFDTIAAFCAAVGYDDAYLYNAASYEVISTKVQKFMFENNNFN